MEAVIRPLLASLWIPLPLIVVAVFLVDHSAGLLSASVLVGVIGLALSSAFSTYLQGLVAGYCLLTEGRVRPGRRISVAGYTGVVESIELRVVVLRLDDGSTAALTTTTVAAGPVTTLN